MAFYKVKILRCYNSPKMLIVTAPKTLSKQFALLLPL